MENKLNIITNKNDVLIFKSVFSIYYNNMDYESDPETDNSDEERNPKTKHKSIGYNDDSDDDEDEESGSESEKKVGVDLEDEEEVEVGVGQGDEDDEEDGEGDENGDDEDEEGDGDGEEEQGLDNGRKQIQIDDNQEEYGDGEGEQDGGGDDDDDDDFNYLQKFEIDVNKNYVNESHPECLSHNSDEIAKFTIVVKNENNIIIDPFHKTIPFLTKYEKARVLGQRSKQIEEGAAPFIKLPENVIDGYIIAEMELKEKKIPFIIRRPIPGGGFEYWKLNDLEML